MLKCKHVAVRALMSKHEDSLVSVDGPVCSSTPNKVMMYKPKTRSPIEKAEYVLISSEQPVPDGFKLLAPGAEIAVKATWLHSALASIRQPKRRKDNQKKQLKMETLIIKRLIDGFYNIYDLAVSGGTTSFQSTPVYKGLKLYAEYNLKMNEPDFKDYWNEKMSWAKKTVARLSKEPINGPERKN